MPRSKEFQEEVVLSRAMEVFWEKGYESTSVQDLVDRMGINRFSIYSTFGDKEGLFLAALDRYGETVVEQRLLEMEKGLAGRSAIQNYFDRLVDAYSRPEGWRGCFMINSAVELGSLDGRAAAQKISEYADRVHRALQTSLKVARKNGELKSRRSTEELAGFLVNQVFGLGVMAKANPERDVLRSRVALAMSVLDTPGSAPA